MKIDSIEGDPYSIRIWIFYLHPQYISTDTANYSIGLDGPKGSTFTFIEVSIAL